MATSKAASSSKRNPARGGNHGFTADGQVDVLREYDTRYPEHCGIRKLPGNGKPPENPFGKEISRPAVGKGGPK